MLGEYNQHGKAIQETVWLGDMPVVVLANNQHYFVYADHLNSPRAITDRTGRVVWRWDSDPFGATAENEDHGRDDRHAFGSKKADEDPDRDGQRFVYNLRFPGQYYDKETGLFYNYFRDYDSETGRYRQSDPIGLRGGLNTYNYVGNNPLRYIDPYGLTAQGAAYGAAIFGGAAAIGSVVIDATTGGVNVFATPNEIAAATAAGAVVGDVISDFANNIYNSQSTKTPNTGEPDSVHENPGSGQERKYGSDGKPEYDIDWDHNHGQGVPHAHNWEGGKRGSGLPISPIPKGRLPKCP